MTRIYLDACALNRLTDDQSQRRIHLEAEAVEKVLQLVWKGEAQWMASVVLEAELRRNPDAEKRNDALALLSFAGESIRPDRRAIERAKTLEVLGYGAFDALHLVCAEQGQADVLLTTDDRFIKRVGRGIGKSDVRVLNPLNWLQEVNP